MSALDYIPPLVAFCAVLVGIVGRPKWDPEESGLRCLTRAGRVTLGIGSLALLSTWVLTWRAHQAADQSSRQRAHLRSIAHTEARLALRQTVHPFFDLFDDYSSEARFQLVPPHVEDPTRLARVAEINMESNAPALSGSTFEMPWNKLLAMNADLGMKRLDTAMQTYAAYLEPDVMEVLSEIRHSEYLVLRLGGAEDLRCYPFVGTDLLTSGMDLRPTGAEAYRDFWNAMRRADRLLQRDEARLARRL